MKRNNGINGLNTSIPELRRKIDETDVTLLQLLNQRAELALAIGKLKASQSDSDADAPIYVPEREKAVLARLMEYNQGPLDQTSVRAIYREIISACRALEKPLSVAYYGPPATYTHIAAMSKFGASAHFVPCSTIREVFLAVETAQANYGVVPVENSTAGAVENTLDVFSTTDARICSEIYVPIHHNLLSKADALSGVRKVFAHPQAFAQCRQWLATHLPHAEVVEALSTAAGAQQATEDPTSATIASRAAAEEYGLNVLFENIEDNPRNRTRFIVIGMNRPERTGHDKTTLMLSVRHEAGALMSALSAFQRHGVNMTMIESRPTKQTPWEYVFFIDVQGYVTDPPLSAAITDLEHAALFVKTLGSFPEAD